MTGTCSNPIKANGTACDDGDACTALDKCQAGVCVGSSLSAYPPGANVWSTSFLGPSVFTKYPDDPALWTIAATAVGTSGRAFLGVTYYVPANVPVSPYGNALYGVDGPGGLRQLGSHYYTAPCFAPYTTEAVDIQVLGASHHVIQSGFLPAGTCQTGAYIDSDNGAFSTLVPFQGTPPLAGGDALGDLLVSGVNGADLRRIDATGVTAYTRTVGAVTALQAGAGGDAYLVGALSASTDVGCGPIAGTGSFAARIDPSGQCVWSRAMPSSVGFLLGGAHDYLTGKFQGTVDLGCGPITSAVAGTRFLAQLDSAGACVWSKSVGTLGARSLPSGEVLLTGSFTGTVDVGCGPVTSGAGASYLVARLDAAGACAWDRTFPVSNASVVPGGADDVALGAVFAGTLDLGDGPLTSSGVQDLAIARLDGATGATLWSDHFGGAGATVSLAGPLHTDAGGGVLASGSLSGTANLGGGPIAGGSFLMRLDGAGGFRWQRSTSGEQIAYDVCGATTVASISDTCSQCGIYKMPTIQVQRIAP